MPISHRTTNEQARKRRFPRRNFSGRTGILFSGRYSVDRAYELGEGGMLFASSHKLSEGKRVAVSFYLPSGALVVARGTVRYVQSPEQTGEAERYGIEFLDMEFQSRREIRNFVAAVTQIDGRIST